MKVSSSLTRKQVTFMDLSTLGMSTHQEVKLKSSRSFWEPATVTARALFATSRKFYLWVSVTSLGLQDSRSFVPVARRSISLSAGQTMWMDLASGPVSRMFF